MFVKYHLDIFADNVLVQKYEDENGELHYTRHEILFNYLYDGNKLTVLDGWFIGAEAFDWAADEDGEWYVNYYFPGLLEQLKGEL